MVKPMDVWVQDIKTGEEWILDSDPKKKVWKNEEGRLCIDLTRIGEVKFFPCQPSRGMKDMEGYQTDIFDFMEDET